MRVLIVDDSSVMRKLTARVLRSSGLALDEVCEAAHGMAALEQIRASAGLPFDLVLTDVHMPGMDGLQLAEAIKQSGGARPAIVMISSETGERHVLRALVAGADGYLCKPFTPDELRARVVPLLRRAGVDSAAVNNATTD